MKKTRTLYPEVQQKLSAVKHGSRMAWTAVTGLVGSIMPKRWRYPQETTFRYHEKQFTADELADYLQGQHRLSNQQIIFFIHGLMVDDNCWRNSDFKMCSAFEDEFGVLAIHINYNSSNHIWQNGQSVAAMLEDLYKRIGSYR